MTLTRSEAIERTGEATHGPADSLTGPEPDGVLRPRRVLTRAIIADAVREALADCSNTRCEISGVGARLVAKLGNTLAGPAPGLVMYGSPKKPETREALSRWGVRYRPGEFLSDYSLGFERGTVFELLIACESEVHPGHGVGYTYETDPNTGRPENGYIWDFRKLLHCPAPHLLLVAWLSDRMFARLQASVERAARDYFRVWQDKSLAVVLIPTAGNRRDQVLIGLGRDGKKPHFARLGAPADVHLSGPEYQREWARLIEVGEAKNGPAFEDLLRRLSERNDYIIQAYAKPLRLRYAGRWASIDGEGRYFLADTREAARKLSQEAFGFAGGVTVKLEEGWGADRLGPRGVA